jgi:hypothetical protein
MLGSIGNFLSKPVYKIPNGYLNKTRKNIELSFQVILSVAKDLVSNIKYRFFPRTKVLARDQNDNILYALWECCSTQLCTAALNIIVSLALCAGPLYAQVGSDSTRDYKTTVNAYPYLYYTPETELAFGAGGVMTFYTKKDSLLNPSNVTFSGFYSTIKTYELSLVSNLFFLRNKVASTIDIRYSNKVDRFYGIGNEVPDIGKDAEYVLTNTGGIIDFQIPATVVISDRAGLVLEYREYSSVERKDNPYLQSDSLTGINGGAVSGMGLVWVWDTRDQVFFPNSGGLTQAKVLFYTKDLGSDFTYSWFEVNSRKYWAFLPDHILAVQIFLQTVGGVPPFFKYPALGGPKIMRGYFEGRYRDKNYFAWQVEYRQYFWWRFGFVAFAGMGDVVNDLTRLALHDLKPSYGAGLRFLFSKEQKINLRIDAGFGQGTNGIYFGIQEAF